MFPPTGKRTECSPGQGGSLSVQAGGGYLQGLGYPGLQAPVGECPRGGMSPWGAGRAVAAPSPPLSAHSKLTRESGTDFPIPVIPPVPDAETEKLIREKDEEVSVGEG